MQVVIREILFCIIVFLNISERSPCNGVYNSNNLQRDVTKVTNSK